MEKVTFTFNDHEITADKNLNVLEAVLQAGYEIPHYCFHNGLNPAGSCRLCAVEVGQYDKDGRFSMNPKLVMACKTPVKESLVVRSDTEKVRRHQKNILEFLLLNHPLDCPICDQAGECYLQDYSYRYGNPVSRFAEKKNKQPKKNIGKNILLHADRCILCTRCVRFVEEISGGAELAVSKRGSGSEIDIVPGQGLNDKMAGNIVDICPVGAMLDKQFLFKQRVWFLKTAESICPRCSRGCNIYIDHHQGVVYRLRPRFNPDVNDYWMCDDGRYGYKFIQAPERLTHSSMGRGETAQPISPERAYNEVKNRFAPYLQVGNGSKMAAVLSPCATCEEQWLLAQWLRSSSREVTLAMGPVFSEKDDEVFKGGFKICAEKIPNRRGAEAVIKQSGTELMKFKELLEAVAQGRFETLWIQGGYPWLDWWPDDSLDKLHAVKVIILQDILKSKLSDRADVVLAGAAWTEKSGSFINDQDQVQPFAKAINPPEQACSEAEWIWRISGRRGQFCMETIHSEMADIVRSPNTPAANTMSTT